MRKQTKEKFILKSKNIFGNKINYSEVNYIDSRSEVILICNEHGKFLIKPKDHLCYKRGCSVCSGVKYNTNTFIKKAIEIHGNKFAYDHTKYSGIKNPITIICKIHGEFLQTPDKHINSAQGCPKCKKSAKKDLAYIIKMGAIIHNGKYDYSKSIFTKMFNKITIICPIHNEFKQTPTNHINHKQDCPACVVGKSKKEKLWLDYMKVPNDFSHRAVILHLNNRRLILDGFDPITNTAYEFYGDFWHGNPNIYNLNDMNSMAHMTFGKLYEKTLSRECLLKTNGYKIISIWEKDFDNLQTRLDSQKKNANG